MSDNRYQANMENPFEDGAMPRESAAKTIPILDPSTPREPKTGDMSNPAAEPDQAQEHWEKLLRVTADFENFKKRVARERSESAKYANTSLLLSLLPVLDNLESAVNAADQSAETSLESLKQGVSMVSQQLRSTLKEAGLTEIEAQGQPFDPNFHEAVSQVESAGVPEGHVLEQLRKGYKLHDRLLRPATVVVAKIPSDPSPAPETSAS
jgi:molecular chaperone GrpE